MVCKIETAINPNSFFYNWLIFLGINGPFARLWYLEFHSHGQMCLLTMYLVLKQTWPHLPRFRRNRRSSVGIKIEDQNFWLMFLQQTNKVAGAGGHLRCAPGSPHAPTHHQNSNPCITYLARIYCRIAIHKQKGNNKGRADCMLTSSSLYARGLLRKWRAQIS